MAASSQVPPLSALVASPLEHSNRRSSLSSPWPPSGTGASRTTIRVFPAAYEAEVLLLRFNTTDITVSNASPCASCCGDVLTASMLMGCSKSDKTSDSVSHMGRCALPPLGIGPGHECDSGMSMRGFLSNYNQCQPSIFCGQHTSAYSQMISLSVKHRTSRGCQLQQCSDKPTDSIDPLSSEVDPMELRECA